MEGLVPAQETNMDLPRAKKETVLGIQSPIKRGIVNLPMEGQDPARDKDRGATMSSQVRAPDTLELDMDKPQLNLEMADIGNPVLVKPVTVRDTQEIQVGILRQLMEDMVPAQGTNMDPPMVRQETVLGTQRPIKGATIRDTQEIQVGILRQLMEDLVPTQETNMDLPMARQETVLGTQLNLPMKGQHLELGKDRGATMSSQGTAPDSLELDMDIPLLDLEMADIGNPVLVSPVTERDMQEIQVDSP